MVNFTRKARTYVTILFLIVFSTSSLSAVSAQMGGSVGSQPCESCGMAVDSVSQAHLKVVDSNGTVHYADCLKCALKLLPKYGALNITATCDWYGPNYIISIALKDHEDTVTVNPSNALYIDGSCSKNRVLSNQSAVDALLANGGVSPYLATLQNVTIPSNSTIMSVVQAARTYAFTDSPLLSVTPTPTPSPTSSPSSTSVPTVTISPTQLPTPTTTPKPATPTPSPLPTAIPTSTIASLKICEVCGMDVTGEAQAKYSIIDGDGHPHYADCIMCALHLVNKYDQLTISTYCDWYGPNYTINIQSSNFGKDVTVNPTTALFLNGGSCVTNRAAFNQTAADLLLVNGYSIHTVSEQRYNLPAETNVATMATAVVEYSKNTTHPSSILPMILASCVGLVIVAVSVVAYKKLRVKTINIGE